MMSKVIVGWWKAITWVKWFPSAWSTTRFQSNRRGSIGDWGAICAVSFQVLRKRYFELWRPSRTMRNLFIYSIHPSLVRSRHRIWAEMTLRVLRHVLEHGRLNKRNGIKWNCSHQITANIKVHEGCEFNWWFSFLGYNHSQNVRQSDETRRTKTKTEK